MGEERQNSFEGRECAERERRPSYASPFFEIVLCNGYISVLSPSVQVSTIAIKSSHLIVFLEQLKCTVELDYLKASYHQLTVISQTEKNP